MYEKRKNPALQARKDRIAKGCADKGTIRLKETRSAEWDSAEHRVSTRGADEVLVGEKSKIYRKTSGKSR